MTGLAVALGAVTLCVACTPGTHARPTPVSTLPAVPYAGAPAVSNPLPVSVLSGDPCEDALTAEQVVAAIGVDVPGKREDLVQTGPACAWSNLDTGGAVGVSYTLHTGVGLSGVYANTQPKSAVWKELPAVQGFPAVAHAGDKGEEIPIGYCQESIGLADSFSIDVSLNLGESKKYTEDACDLVTQIADMTVTALKAKAGS